MTATTHRSSPGIQRENRISAEGLARLQKQLETGAKISRPVMLQWIHRYGNDARVLFTRHGYITPPDDLPGEPASRE